VKAVIDKILLSWADSVSAPNLGSTMIIVLLFKKRNILKLKKER
jgi:hypothetical protein